MHLSKAIRTSSIYNLTLPILKSFATVTANVDNSMSTTSKRTNNGNNKVSSSSSSSSSDAPDTMTTVKKGRVTGMDATDWNLTNPFTGMTNWNVMSPFDNNSNNNK